MYLLMFGISEPLTELASRAVTFSLILGAMFLIPYIILLKVFGDRDIARYISGGLCLVLLVITIKNGMFFNFFDLTK